MSREFAYGVIPVRFETQPEVLIVLHTKGHWGFPKGHAESNETPLQTATRELFEETSLHLEKILTSQPITEHYTYTHSSGEVRRKTVEYYLATVSNEVPIAQEAEVSQIQWVTFEAAKNILTFPEALSVLAKAKIQIELIHG